MLSPRYIVCKDLMNWPHTEYSYVSAPLDLFELRRLKYKPLYAVNVRLKHVVPKQS